MVTHCVCGSQSTTNSAVVRQHISESGSRFAVGRAVISLSRPVLVPDHSRNVRFRAGTSQFRAGSTFKRIVWALAPSCAALFLWRRIWLLRKAVINPVIRRSRLQAHLSLLRAQILCKSTQNTSRPVRPRAFFEVTRDLNGRLRPRPGA